MRSKASMQILSCTLEMTVMKTGRTRIEEARHGCSTSSHLSFSNSSALQCDNATTWQHQPIPTSEPSLSHDRFPAPLHTRSSLDRATKMINSFHCLYRTPCTTIPKPQNSGKKTPPRTPKMPPLNSPCTQNPEPKFNDLST